jgi:hypothetical protein
VEDWRVSIRLRTKRDAKRVHSTARATVGDVMSREKAAVYAYAGNRAQAAHMRVLLERASVGLGQEPHVERWNPATSEWQDPDLPIGPPPREEAEPYVDLDRLQWEVRLKAASFWDVRRVHDSLQPHTPRLHVGWKRLSVGARTQRQAHVLAERLKRRAGAGAVVEVRRLTRRRRWLLRQGLWGNYATGSGGGGNGGGGNGGG